MTTPLLSTAANGHLWITFEDRDTPQWRSAIAWLRREGFAESGDSVTGLDEGILPSYARQGVAIAVGFDSWSGDYLLAECGEGDEVILQVASHVSADDRRAAG